MILFAIFHRTFCSVAMKILNVAEKNDVAKNVAEIISNGRYAKREGLSVYNKIYQFEANVFNQRCSMVMTSVSGHLLNYEFVGSYKSWNACNPISLFEAPMEKRCLPEMENIQKTLEREIRPCTTLIIWTDCDREGENIGFEVIKVCKNVKDNIRIYRAKFSELTTTAIFRALQNLAQPNEKINNAVDVRQELDLRIGAAFTRFQTMRLQKVFPQALNDRLISYGSCQFPTLGFVVERYKQVMAFVPEPFWKLVVRYEEDEERIEFAWKRHRLFDHTCCLVLHEICLENPMATVVNVQSKPKSKWRPLPLDTVEFEKIASRKLRINAKTAMSVAERLYTRGFISYPRTETNIFPQGMDLTPLIQMQSNDLQWGEFATRVVNDGPNPRQGTKTDNAHPPIHPTKYTNDLHGDEKSIYEFVVRHFLACCSKDAEGRETTVEIDVANERFSVSGLIILAKNYLEVYIYEKWQTKIIPHFEMNQTFRPSSIDMIESKTTSPPLLTEADLIALMDKHGIGTDATHADHIETIKQRFYVGLTEQNLFLPGELGFGLVDGYDSMGFAMSKPHLRAELEADLQKICDGIKLPQIVLAEQIAKYRSVFEEAVKQAGKLDEALSQYYGAVQQVVNEDPLTEITKCPNCISHLVLKKRRNGPGYFIACLAYPNCQFVIWLPFTVEDVQVGAQCENCERPTKMFKFRFQRGSLTPFFPDDYDGCLGCNEDLLNALDLRSLHKANCNFNNGAATNDNFRPRANNSVSRERTFSAGDNIRPRANNSVSGERTSSAGDNIRPRTNNVVNRPISSNNSAINCLCGIKASELTVRKEGPNKGRQFYACSKSAGNDCQFFSWKDEGDNNQPVRLNTGPSRITVGPANTIANSEETVKCHCDLPSKKLCVQRDGANKGRYFLTCSKPMEQKCRFFQWFDELDSVQNRKFSTRATTSNNNPIQNNKTRKKPTCSICHREGHTKRTCGKNR